MPTGRRGLPTTNTGLSIEPDLLKRAKKEAKRKRMSFSAYVCQLLADDLVMATLPDTDHDRLAVLESHVAEMRAQFGRKPRANAASPPASAPQ
jgi:hypothetical protein